VNSINIIHTIPSCKGLEVYFCEKIGFDHEIYYIFVDIYTLKGDGIMAAVLNKTGVLDKKEVWTWTDESDEVGKASKAAGKAKPPRTTLTNAELDEIGISERNYAKMSVMEQVAYDLRLDGQEVWVVDESDDELDINRYLSADTRKYLAAKREEWRKKDENTNNS